MKIVPVFFTLCQWSVHFPRLEILPGPPAPVKLGTCLMSSHSRLHDVALVSGCISQAKLETGLSGEVCY